MNPAPREAVIVAVDANRSKGSVEAVEWALRHVVRRGDIFLVLGVFHDQVAKKNSCFPAKLLMGLGVSGIWERLEFFDHAEVDPVELEEEFKRKRAEYCSSLRPLDRQCRKNEVTMVFKLMAGYCPARLAICESQNLNTRWIVLDSHFRKSKVFLRGHVTCNIAVVKEKELASLFLANSQTEMCSRIPEPNNNSAPAKHQEEQHNEGFSAKGQSPCCYPLSWRSGFPRTFAYNELEVITNGFSDDNIIRVVDDIVVYQGILQETHVLITAFPETSEGFWSMVNMLSRVCHRNILNLVGFCSAGVSASLLFDFPCMGTVEVNLKCDELAEKLGWRARWSIALEIGGSLRYLHEECVDGPIVHKSVCAFSIALSHGYSAMLCNFTNAEWLKRDFQPTEDLIAEYPNFDGEECLFVDVHDYGKFLLELITGKSANCFHDQGKNQSLIDWALPLLKNGQFSELMDCRLMETTGDGRMVRNMAHAALYCLRIDADHKLSINKALAIVRGDELAIFEH